jgi:ammonia channel protein AmtB
MVSFIYAFILSLCVFPLVFGWTLDDGFLTRLGLVDFSGACSIHLVAGFGSLFGAIMIKPRLGRFEPLAVKKMIEAKEIYLQNSRKHNVQNKIDWISKDISFKKDISMEKQVEKARKLILKIDEDTFYSTNSDLLIFIGTIIMWFSLCHL